MSSPLCANCSRDSNREWLGKGPVAQVGTEKQVGAGVEVMCSQFEVTDPVVKVDSLSVVVGPVVKVRGPVALIEVESVVQAVTVPAVEVIGPAYEPANPLAHVGPWLKTGSVTEVGCSVVKSVFFANRSVPSAISVGPGGLGSLVSEVIVSVEGSIGPVVKVGPSVTDPMWEATDSELELWESTLTSLWLSST